MEAAAAGDELLELWLEPFDPADYEDHRPLDDLNEDQVVDFDFNDGDLARREPGPRSAEQPKRPPQHVIDEHELTHLPYQGWCDHCVAGRAQIAPHKRRDKTQDEIPVIQMDYLEWTRKLLEADPNSGTMSLTLVDTKSGMMWASMVLRKGAWPYVEEAVARFVISLKYREVILQTDGENAILLVARKIAAKLRASNITVTTRQTPRYDSQSNGPVENAPKNVAARCRTLLTACASKYGVELDATSYVFPWAVRHAAWCFNRYHKDEQSTPYYVVNGRAYDGELCVFGETVHYLPVGSTKSEKYKPRWRRGVWCGKSELGDQH